MEPDIFTGFDFAIEAKLLKRKKRYINLLSPYDFQGGLNLGLD